MSESTRCVLGRPYRFLLKGNVTYGNSNRTLWTYNNASYFSALPSIHPMFGKHSLRIRPAITNFILGIPTEPNGGNHTALFAASARTKEAHAATLVVIKALAHTGFRVIDDDKFFEEVRGRRSSI